MFTSSPPPEISAPGRTDLDAETYEPGDDGTASRAHARSEGQMVVADPATAAAMASELQRVGDLQRISLEVVADTDRASGGPRVAPRQSVRGCHTQVDRSRCRGEPENERGPASRLAGGPLTFGRFYDVFPFDNRLAHLTLSADDLERVFAAELRRGRRGGLEISGVPVRADCRADMSGRRAPPVRRVAGRERSARCGHHGHARVRVGVRAGGTGGWVRAVRTRAHRERGCGPMAAVAWGTG